jgi:hypothetical protein
VFHDISDESRTVDENHQDTDSAGNRPPVYRSGYSLLLERYLARRFFAAGLHDECRRVLHSDVIKFPRVSKVRRAKVNRRSDQVLPGAIGACIKYG